MSKSTKVIPVWVNAGDKAVTLNRIDGGKFELPLFVNVPNGVREAIVAKLEKVDGRATVNLSWQMPVAMIQRSVIKTGENAGKSVMSVTITEEFLEDWLSQLNETRRGAVKPAVKSVLDAWVAKRPADDHVDVTTLSGFNDEA